MAATTKLIVWNAALREIASAPIADVSTANTSQLALSQAWDHAVEHVLAMADWGFARRRATLAGVSDTSFSPYTYRFTKPSDYLRKCWVKSAAPDDYQADHAEIAAVFYGLQSSVLLEYVSDHADNYDPANWPPHFTRMVTIYLAMQVAPKLARAGADDFARLGRLYEDAKQAAERFESVFLTNTAIAANRQPVMRRALEFLGQQLAGSVSIHSHTDRLRWHMNQAWPHAVKYCLELGAWNFATFRIVLEDGVSGDTVIPSSGDSGVIEGYSIGPAAEVEAAASASEFDYGYALPSGFLHKLWIKDHVGSPYECEHQIIGGYIFTNYDPCVMEYVASSTYSQDPANWSANFLDVVACQLALMVCPELTVEEDGRGRMGVKSTNLRQALEQMFARKLSDAKTRDAIQQNTKVIPSGRFVRSRAGGANSMRRVN